MDIITPAEIESVAWEGELETSGVSFSPSTAACPVVSLGRPEIWPAADALESKTGEKWTPPQGAAHFWLVRLACTIRAPSGPETIRDATQALFLRPQPHAAAIDCVYAHSLYPLRLGAEDSAEFNVTLGPELGFASGASVKVGEVGAKINYRKVFPVIQAYGAGEATPYWVFKPHATNPLDGSQYVYAVLAARSPASGIRAHVEVTVTLQTAFGPVKFGTPRAASQHTMFEIA